MKTAFGMLLVVALMVALAWGFTSTPVLQVSSTTKQPVACACEATGWKMTNISHPACAEVAKGRADVEWVQ